MAASLRSFSLPTEKSREISFKASPSFFFLEEGTLFFLVAPVKFGLKRQGNSRSFSLVPEIDRITKYYISIKYQQ